MYYEFLYKYFSSVLKLGKLQDDHYFTSYPKKVVTPVAPHG